MVQNLKIPFLGAGLQHNVLFNAEPRGLNLSEKILPQYLKELGYSTHLIGKVIDFFAL